MIELIRFNRRINLHYDTWASIRHVGENFGWLPQGTERPDDSYQDWDGNYGSNDRQRVRTADAIALSEALAQALEVYRLVRMHEDNERIGSEMQALGQAAGLLGKDFDPDVAEEVKQFFSLGGCVIR